MFLFILMGNIVIKNRITLIFILVAFCTGAFAQSLSEIALKDVRSGTDYQISKLKSKQVAVLIFWSNRCAYNAYYVDRIKTLQQEFSGKGVEFVLVNAFRSDLIIEESEQEMVDYLKENQLTLAYLVDAEQQLKEILNASRSPEVFVLRNQDGKLSVVYSGAIDDSPQSEGDVNHPYLKQTILSLLANEKLPGSNNRPVGCLIR